MAIGNPPSPTFRSIFGGIGIVVLILLGFVFLANIVKFVGATFTFIPAKLGLIQVVKSEEVIAIDVSSSPTSITINEAGRYSLYVDNYDLLTINDAVVAGNAKPWFNIEFAKTGENLNSITLVERGLAIYDTPLAKGRPVATIDFPQPGEYIFIHPRRPATAYFLPDYTTGHESFIIFLIIVQVVALIIIIRDIWGALRSRKTAGDE